jgi:hypothetical protein
MQILKCVKQLNETFLDQLMISSVKYVFMILTEVQLVVGQFKHFKR